MASTARAPSARTASDLLPATPKDEASLVDISTDALLHPKYGVPAECFAYVENAADPRTWKLPYRLVTGDLDVKRLPKGIQSILSNYRGAQVRTVPETAIPDVLARLARGAADLGRMPFQRGDAADNYAQLETALDQLGRLDRRRAPARPAACGQNQETTADEERSVHRRSQVVLGYKSHRVIVGNRAARTKVPAPVRWQAAGAAHQREARGRCRPGRICGRAQ